MGGVLIAYVHPENNVSDNLGGHPAGFLDSVGTCRQRESCVSLELGTDLHTSRTAGSILRSFENAI